MTRYRTAVLITSGQETARMFPTSMSFRCSLSDVALLMARMVAAEATAYVMPMIASCGMRALLLRTVEKIAAPRRVEATLIQYTPDPCGSSFEKGMSSAME